MKQGRIWAVVAGGFGVALLGFGIFGAAERHQDTIIYAGSLIGVLGPACALWLQNEADGRAVPAKDDNDPRDRVVRRLSELKPVLEILSRAPNSEALGKVIEAVLEGPSS